MKRRSVKLQVRAGVGPLAQSVKIVNPAVAGGIEGSVTLPVDVSADDRVETLAEEAAQGPDADAGGVFPYLCFGAVGQCGVTPGHLVFYLFGQDRVHENQKPAAQGRVDDQVLAVGGAQQVTVGNVYPAAGKFDFSGPSDQSDPQGSGDFAADVHVAVADDVGDPAAGIDGAADGLEGGAVVLFFEVGTTDPEIKEVPEDEQPRGPRGHLVHEAGEQPLAEVVVAVKVQVGDKQVGQGKNL